MKVLKEGTVDGIIFNPGSQESAKYSVREVLQKLNESTRLN
jgi:hypothetical protein